MAGLFSSPKAPKPPPPPPSVDDAAEEQYKQDAARKRKGMQASILTGPGGVEPSQVGVKTLLGA